MTEQEWLDSKDPVRLLTHLTNWPTGSPRRDNPRHPSDRKLRLFACACAALCRCGSEQNRALASPDEWAKWPDVLGCKCTRVVRAALLRCIVGNPFRPWARSVINWGRNEKRYHWSDGRAVSVGEWNELLKSGRLLKAEWLTPDVLAVAAEAYERRGRRCRHCEDGKIRIGFGGKHGYGPPTDCPVCGGTGTVDDGTLDPERLAVLSDALEEAGCVGEPCPYCKDADFSVGDFGGPMMGGKEPYASRAKAYWNRNCVCKGERRLPSPLLAHLRSPGPHYRGCWAIDCILGKQ